MRKYAYSVVDEYAETIADWCKRKRPNMPIELAFEECPYKPHGESALQVIREYVSEEDMWEQCVPEDVKDEFWGDLVDVLIWQYS